MFFLQRIIAVLLVDGRLHLIPKNNDSGYFDFQAWKTLTYIFGLNLSVLFLSQVQI